MAVFYVDNLAAQFVLGLVVDKLVAVRSRVKTGINPAAPLNHVNTCVFFLFADLNHQFWFRFFPFLGRTFGSLLNFLLLLLSCFNLLRGALAVVYCFRFALDWLGLG